MTRSRSPKQYLGVLAQNPPNTIVAQRAPTSADTQYYPGDLWVDQTGLTAFANSAGGTWIAIGTGAVGGIVTLTGTTGGALSPTAGNMNILGTANQLAFAGSGSTLTGSLSATLIAPGSITSTTTITSGTTLTGGTGITATTGNIVASAGNISATLGSVTAGTSITATLGNITATNGNIVRGTAGNKDVYSSVASTTTAGANSAGTVTLVGGTATVATTAVTAASQVRLYRQGIGATGAAALGIITLGTKTAGVSFIINAVQAADATALQASDVSSIGWEIVN